MSRKTEHRAEFRDVAQQLDAIALPLRSTASGW